MNSKLDIESFFDNSKSNPIKNSEELRKLFFEEKAKMGNNCSNCQLIGLKTKYRNKLKNRNLI